MSRRLFGIASVASLLLWGAVMLLWLRSCWVNDSVERVKSETSYSLGTFCGMAYLSAFHYEFVHEPDGWQLHRWEARPIEVWRRKAARLRPWVINWRYDNSHSWRVRVHLWVIAAMTLLLPVTRLAIRMRGASRVPGSCSVCGYDLRST